MQKLSKGRQGHGKAWFLSIYPETIHNISPKSTNKYAASSSHRLCIAFVNCLDASVKNLQMQNTLKDEELRVKKYSAYLLNYVLPVYNTKDTNILM